MKKLMPNAATSGAKSLIAQAIGVPCSIPFKVGSSLLATPELLVQAAVYARRPAPTDERILR